MIVPSEYCARKHRSTERRAWDTGVIRLRVRAFLKCVCMFRALPQSVCETIGRGIYGLAFCMDGCQQSARHKNVISNSCRKIYIHTASIVVSCHHERGRRAPRRTAQTRTQCVIWHCVCAQACARCQLAWVATMFGVFAMRGYALCVCVCACCDAISIEINT